MNRRQEFLKACLDRSLAIVAIACASPILLAAALWIYLASPGPILFRQQRVGRGQQLFRIYKFRTMHEGASGHALGSVTVRSDPRLIPGGEWLRKSKIDELPQLFNVLQGTMSLVGPRPTVAEDYERMTDRQRDRALVKPGITGLAQISGAASITWPERIVYDLEYIEQYRLALDLKILAQTCVCIARGDADLNPPDGDEWGDDARSAQASDAQTRQRAA